MKYTDDKGNTLYGFSQHNLDQLVFLLRLLVAFLGGFLVLSTIVVYWMHSHDYLTRILEVLAR